MVTVTVVGKAVVVVKREAVAVEKRRPRRLGCRGGDGVTSIASAAGDSSGVMIAVVM